MAGGRRQERGFANVRVITGDINTFDLGEEEKGKFDRVMSIEMFEHMKNYQLLIAKVSGWLAPGGKLFGKCFCVVRGVCVSYCNAKCGFCFEFGAVVKGVVRHVISRQRTRSPICL